MWAFNLTSPLSGEQYRWSTGATSPGIIVQETGEYWLELIRFGEVRRDTIFVEIIDEYKVYPNLSNGILKLELSSLEDKMSHYEIYDMLGRLVKKDGIITYAGRRTYELNLNSMRMGQYLLYLELPCGRSVVEKIMLL